MNTCGCSARYQWSAVVPAFAAPMMMKFGSVTEPEPLPGCPSRLRTSTARRSSGAVPCACLRIRGRLVDGVLDLVQDVAELPVGVDPMHDRPLESEIGRDRVAESHVFLRLVLRASRVASERHVERGREMEDEVRRRDVPVQAILERRQDATNGETARREREMPELRSIRVPSGARRIPIAQDDGSVR